MTLGCKECRALLAGYIDGELAIRDQRAAQDHLSQCAQCRQSRAHLEEVIDLYRNHPLSAPAHTSRARALNIAQEICRRQAQGPQFFRIQYPLRNAARIAVILMGVVMIVALFQMFELALAEKPIPEKHPRPVYSRLSLETVTRIRGVFETELGDSKVLIEDTHTARLSLLELQSITRGYILSAIEDGRVTFHSRTGRPVQFRVTPFGDADDRQLIESWLARMERNWARRNFFAPELEYVSQRAQQGFAAAVTLLESISREPDNALALQAQKILGDEVIQQTVARLHSLNATPADPARQALIANLSHVVSPYLLADLRAIARNEQDPCQCEAIAALARSNDLYSLPMLQEFSHRDELPVRTRMAVHEALRALLEQP